MQKRKVTKEDPAEHVEEPLTDAEALELENAHLKAQNLQLQLEAATKHLTELGVRIAGAHPREGYEAKHLDLGGRRVIFARKPT